MWVRFLGWEDPLEEGTATHSGILAWRIPRTEEPGGAIVHRVAKSWTRLKQLSMHALQVQCNFNLAGSTQRNGSFCLENTGILN